MSESNPSEWYWTAGKDNVEDWVTRGKSITRDQWNHDADKSPIQSYPPKQILSTEIK